MEVRILQNLKRKLITEKLLDDFLTLECSLCFNCLRFYQFKPFIQTNNYTTFCISCSWSIFSEKKNPVVRVRITLYYSLIAWSCDVTKVIARSWAEPSTLICQWQHIVQWLISTRMVTYQRLLPTVLFFVNINAITYAAYCRKYQSLKYA